MARPRKPWLRKSNKHWYVEVAGKQVDLGREVLYTFVLSFWLWLVCLTRSLKELIDIFRLIWHARVGRLLGRDDRRGRKELDEASGLGAMPRAVPY